jgi:predicted nucleic acid-binding protein
LIQRSDLLDQPIQVLQEFYAQATRATRPHPLPHADAVDLITAWTRFRVQEIDLSILKAALEIRAAHRFSYWDSAIIAPPEHSAAKSCIPRT